MSNEKKMVAAADAAPELPKGIPPELIPVYDWWVKEGRSLLLMLAVAAVAVGGFYGYRNWSAGRIAAANQALASAYNADDLETAVAQYGSTKVGGALKLRLAKAYYDAGRYQDALDTYDRLVAEGGAPEGFGDIAVVGRAFALEGLGKFDEAKAAYDGFAGSEAGADSCLLLTAQLGSARVTARTDKAAALKALETLKAGVKGDDKLALARIERLTDTVKRFQPRAERSLFDAANAAAKALEPTAAPAAAPIAAPATGSK